MDLPSLWVKIGIKQTVALAQLAIPLKTVRRQEKQEPGKMDFQETITFIF